MPGEQPAARQHLALGMGYSPPGAQPLQQQGTEHGVAVLAALALLDAQRHALAVDIADLERHDLADPKPGAVRDGQGRLVLQIGGRSDQARSLVATEHHR
jgi:hypothetical protein